MSKFKKRLSKVANNLENAVVVGTGFGYLQDIVETFQTVFLINEEVPELRARNLVYRETFGDLAQLNSVSIIFLDRKKTNQLGSLPPIWNRSKSLVIIEGKEVIGRELSQVLYQNGFRAVEQQKTHHVWKMKQ